MKNGTCGILFISFGTACVMIDWIGSVVSKKQRRNLHCCVSFGLTGRREIIDTLNTRHKQFKTKLILHMCRPLVKKDS